VRLKKLREIARDKNLTVKKMSIRVQLAVYKDIIPGYVINDLQYDWMCTEKMGLKIYGYLALTGYDA